MPKNADKPSGKCKKLTKRIEKRGGTKGSKKAAKKAAKKVIQKADHKVSSDKMAASIKKITDRIALKNERRAASPNKSSRKNSDVGRSRLNSDVGRSRLNSDIGRVGQRATFERQSA